MDSSPLSNLSQKVGLKQGRRLKTRTALAVLTGCPLSRGHLLDAAPGQDTRHSMSPFPGALTKQQSVHQLSLHRRLLTSVQRGGAGRREGGRSYRHLKIPLTNILVSSGRSRPDNPPLKHRGRGLARLLLRLCNQAAPAQH